jgi:Flp pilus assembly protein TadG
MLRKVQHMLARLRGLGECTSGTAIIEAAISAPFIVLLLAGVYELGTAMYRQMALEGAARAGAEYYARHPGDLTGARTTVQSASGMDPTSLTVNVAMICECPNGAAVSCTTGTCSTPGPFTRFVTVQVTQNYASLLPIPGFMRPSTLTGNIVMRL